MAKKDGYQREKHMTSVFVLFSLCHIRASTNRFGYYLKNRNINKLSLLQPTLINQLHKIVINKIDSSDSVRPKSEIRWGSVVRSVQKVRWTEPKHRPNQIPFLGKFGMDSVCGFFLGRIRFRFNQKVRVRPSLKWVILGVSEQIQESGPEIFFPSD